jgi:hypothetical protein
MEFSKTEIKSCCGGSSTVLTLSGPITDNVVSQLILFGFDIKDIFIKAGIVYAEGHNVILTGPIGSNRFNIKFLSEKDVEQKLNELEAIIKKIG